MDSNKVESLIDVFRKGSQVDNPELWKSGQLNATMLGGFFIAIVQAVKAFGYNLPIDSETATLIAAGVIGFVNFILTLTTSTKVGILPAKDANASTKQ